MEHNISENPIENDKTFLKFCQNPISCDKCRLTLKTLNKLRLDNLLKGADENKSVFLMQSRILPTDFFINFQNISSIENLFSIVLDRANERILKKLQNTKVFAVTYIEESEYYKYPILNLDIYFIGNLSSEAIIYLTDIGRHTFPLYTGDIGMFEILEKSIDDIVFEINSIVESEIDDSSGLFENLTHNIYGTESLKSQLRFLALFNIHAFEFKENNPREFEIPTFFNYFKYNPGINE